jgi:hypothetical protein
VHGLFGKIMLKRAYYVVIFVMVADPSSSRN